MAVRPVFAADYYGKLCKRINTEFTFARGMAKAQKTKCSINLRQAFQGGKIMEGADGPLEDLYNVLPLEAKQDSRHSGSKLKGFAIDGIYFDLTPQTAFYNWVYLHVLSEHPEIGDELMNYDAFTDIAFNPDKSINCQAEACAFYVSLRKKGMLERALENKENFLDILYG